MELKFFQEEDDAKEEEQVIIAKEHMFRTQIKEGSQPAFHSEFLILFRHTVPEGASHRHYYRDYKEPD